MNNLKRTTTSNVLVRKCKAQHKGLFPERSQWYRFIGQQHR